MTLGLVSATILVATIGFAQSASTQVPVTGPGTHWERRDAVRYCEVRIDSSKPHPIMRPDSTDAVTLARRVLGTEGADWEVLEFHAVNGGIVVQLGIPRRRRGPVTDGTQTLFVDPDRCVTQLWW